MIMQMDKEDPASTAQMRSLILAFVVRSCIESAFSHGVVLYTVLQTLWNVIKSDKTLLKFIYICDSMCVTILQCVVLQVET